MTTTHEGPANRLARETSPYLLQHAHNPVDWYPWGPEALARARDESKPIFLSIGYSACHWCHVMERESFENAGIAALMNEHFVNIKVDREERPDLDDIYMKATQVVSGHGGWPMSVFLTPELKPFYAGTYFPSMPRYGQPGFPSLLQQLSQMWTSDPDRCREQGDKVVVAVERLTFTAEHLPELPLDVKAPGLDLIDTAVEQLARGFDSTHGGFGGEPKFPHADDIRLLIHHFLDASDHPALRMAEHTLDAMARGGIYDQLGGGFSRYSVDARWWIPHFEKMLYDNALLIPAYLEAHRVTGRQDFATVARECCEWVLREMVGDDGGFYSTQDADSEGEEGKFFRWEREEVHRIVGKRHRKLVDVAWNLGDEPNFEGAHWVLVRPRPDAELAKELGTTPEQMHADLAPLRRTLFELRDKRVHPGTDDKVLVAWNGLMIGALARAARVLAEPRFLQAAQRAADYCLTTMRPDGRRLLATSRAGKAHLNGTLADYAYLAAGLLDLFEADGDLRWPTAALSLVDVVAEHFADTERAGWFFTSDDHETLVARPRDLFDGAVPSSNGVMIEVLYRLFDLTGDTDLRTASDRALATTEPIARSSPTAFARSLIALLRHATGAPTVVVTEGEGFDELWATLATHRHVSLSAVRVPAAGVTPEQGARFALLLGKASIDGKATAYVCRHGSCREPTHDVAGLIRLLD